MDAGSHLGLEKPSSVAAAASGITSIAAKPEIGFSPGLPGPHCSTATTTCASPKIPSG